MAVKLDVPLHSAGYDSSLPSSRSDKHLVAKLLTPSQTTETSDYVQLLDEDESVLDGENKKPIRKHSSIEEFFTQAKSSIFSSAINICNANIGAGILVLPYAVYRSGWVIGVVFFIVFALLSSFSFQLLMSVGLSYCDRGNISSYAIVCNDVAPSLQIWINAFIAFGYGLTCSAYLIIIGNYMPLVALELGHLDPHSDSIFLKRQFWIAIFLIVLISPTTTLKKLDQLRFSSMIAITCFIYVTVIIILYFMNDINKAEVRAFPSSAFALFESAPIYIFAYGGHPLAFILTTELKRPTLNRINITLMSAFGFVSIIYTVCGMFGYFTFGDLTKSNILLNYPNGDTAIIIVRIGLSVAIAFSYPVIASPWKQSVAALLFKVDKKGKDATDLVWYKYYSIVVLLILTTFGVSMATDNLGIISELQGATAGTFLQIVTPGLIYYFYDKKYAKDKSNKMSNNPMHRFKLKGAIFLIVFGTIMIPIATTLVFIT